MCCAQQKTGFGRFGLNINTDVQQLLTLGTEAMNRRQFPEALLIFSQIVENFPDFAEGWNKRATLYYLVGNTDASIEQKGLWNSNHPFRCAIRAGSGLPAAGQARAGRGGLQLITVHPNSPSAQDNLRLVRKQRAVNVI